jgi:hypothetical protein
MPAGSPIYQEIRLRFANPTTVESALIAFGRIDDLERELNITRGEAAELKILAFPALRELTTDDPMTAQTVILELLLPHCLRDATHEDGEAFLARSRFREILRDWIEELAALTGPGIRDNAIRQLSEALKSEDPAPACWTIAVLGYRNREAVDLIWDVVETRDDEAGDGALSVLTLLGPTAAERGKILHAIRARDDEVQSFTYRRTSASGRSRVPRRDPACLA